VLNHRKKTRGERDCWKFLRGNGEDQGKEAGGGMGRPEAISQYKKKKKNKKKLKGLPPRENDLVERAAGVFTEGKTSRGLQKKGGRGHFEMPAEEDDGKSEKS